MKTFFSTLTLFGRIILFFTVCYVKKTTPSTSGSAPHEEPPEHPAFYQKSESSYYYFTEAQMQKNRGNLEKAIHFLEKAIEIDPASSFLKRELAFIYLQQKKNAKALKTVKEIIDGDPNNIEALIMYGKIKNHLIQELEQIRGNGLFKNERVIASRCGCGVKSN